MAIATNVPFVWHGFLRGSADEIIDNNAWPLSPLVQRLVLNECDSCSVRLNLILTKMLLVPNRSMVKQIQDNGGLVDSSLLQDPRGLRRLSVQRKLRVCFTCRHLEAN
jgi:hypothetical protein